MKDKEGKGTSGSVMAGLLCAQLEATAIYLGHPATQQQKSDWMELDTGALLRESQLAREALQLKQTLELGIIWMKSPGRMRPLPSPTSWGSCIACGPYGTGRRRTQRNTMRR